MGYRRSESPWTIRAFRPGDGPHVRRIVRDTLVAHGLPPSEETDGDLDEVEHSYADGRFYVVTLHGAVKGCGGVRRVEPGVAEIRKMYFLPELRGLGAGRALLDRLVDDARALGATRVFLETHEALSRAIALYEKNGFSVAKDRRPDTPRCDRVMERVLDD